MYDAIIIGAGVTGCAIARELSRQQIPTPGEHKAWCWKKKRTSAAEPPKQTAPSSMPDTTQSPAP